ncbi:MAG TPA: hypothetical protein VN694_03355 [Caulobacteraceae bacterium]|nr:hypothetical protein [Caulobacteraceae bacterium]
MDAQTVIESYVRDVTQRLPRRTRADVALELRALLMEELAARAAGRAADEAMAVELVRGFGAPGEVAGRYRPAAPLLDAADTRPFIMAAIAGALVIMAGVAIAPAAGAHPHQAANAATGAILGWLGFLFVVFAARSWAQRHWPSLTAWRPHDPEKVSRAASLALVAVIVLGIVCYGAPTWVAAQFTGGPVPAWMTTVAYAPDFQANRLPWLFGLWVAQALLILWVALEGRWRAPTRRIEAGLLLGVSLALIWFLAAGPMFQTAAVDHTAKAWLAPVAILMLVYAVWKVAKLSRPPAPPMQPGASSLAI